MEIRERRYWIYPGMTRLEYDLERTELETKDMFKNMERQKLK